MNLKYAIEKDKLREFISQVKVPDDNENQVEDFERLLKKASKPRSKKEAD